MKERMYSAILRKTPLNAQGANGLDEIDTCQYGLPQAGG